MKLMKTLMLTLCLSLTTQIALSKKAHGGLLLSPATGGATAVMAIGQGVLIGATGAKFLSLIGFKTMGRLWGIGLVLVALEDEVEQTSDNIQQVLSSRYPMIMDPTVFEDIAYLVLESQDVTEYNYGVLNVKVEEQQLEYILERLDQRGIEQSIEQLKKDLL